MKRNKKTVAILLSLVMCMAILAACAPAPAGTAPGPGATPGTGPAATPDTSPSIAAAAPEDPDVTFASHIDLILSTDNLATLNPMLAATNNGSSDMSRMMLHERLIERNHDTGDILPALAHHWITEDFQTFRFYLRDDVYFHNGEKLTADDVVFTIELASASPGAPAQGHWATGLIDTVTAVEEYVVEIVLDRVNPDYFFGLSMPAAVVLSRAAVEADPDLGWKIGAGAFELVEFSTNDFVEFRRNENYWNENKNIVTESMMFRFIPEPGARTIMMERGDAQVSKGTTPEDLPRFQEAAGFEVIPVHFNLPAALVFNMEHPLMSEYYFRMAVMHAIDRPTVAIFAAGDWNTPIMDSGTVWGRAQEFRNDTIPPIQFNQDEARRFLELSSYNGEELEIATAIVTHVRGSQAIQEQLRQVGINVVVNEFDAPGLQAYMINPDNDPHMSLINLSVTLSAASARNFLFPGGNLNFMRYNNPEVNELLDAAISMTDVDERRATYMRIQEIVAQDPPAISMYHRINAIVARNGVGGIQIWGDHRLTDVREMFFLID
ncbi:MAG: ABC transporter substrate-binding protein [Oscillospiraceae bacterium]|nr:ABC transporter substrate-binding protein [Oscillospiraceae bacterium]